MLNIQDHQTGYIFDPWSHLGPKRRKLLESSWAGVFRHYLLNKLPVGKLAPHFNKDMGRPSKELYQITGGIILQQMQDLSDEEAQWHMCFDQGWHYALDIISQSDEDSYVCERTLFMYRQIILEEGIDSILFESLTDELINVFDVDTGRQRIDSTHIQSNMRKLGRVRIFAETIKKFLTNLKRQHQEIFEFQISAELSRHYLSKKAFGCFSQVKPSEADPTLQDLSKDLLYLVELFKEHSQVNRLNSYQLMERVLQDHCIVSDQGDGPQTKMRPPKDISSDSLQNPSDPDAGYSGHKGQGYTAQIMETYTPDKDKPGTEEQDLLLELITYVEVTPAYIGDSRALEEAIEGTAERGCKPEEIDADAAYGSDDNVRKASQRGVKLVSPAHSSDGQGGKLGIKDFECDKKTCMVQKCPQGQKSIGTYRTLKGRTVSRFDVTACRNCPEQKRCPVRLKTTSARLYYTDKLVRLALRRQYEQTDEFRDHYRWRAGIEATNSRLKSQTGAGRLRVRGLANVRFAIKLKALGLNILRAARVYAARIQKERPVPPVAQAVSHLYSSIMSKITDFSRNLLSKSYKFYVSEISVI